MAPHILVIEDEDYWYNLFRKILEGMGCAVDVAKDDNSAMDLLQKSSYELVLLDACLDRTDFDLARHQFCDDLHQEYPDLPIVATTGKPLSATDGFLLAKLGAVDYIHKGEIQLPDLRRRIQAVLQRPSHGWTAFRNSRALLIGVGNYTHRSFASLPATTRDVQALAAILADPDRCGYSKTSVQIVTDPHTTAANIRTALCALAQSTDDQSTVVVYFSGHGGRALENATWRAYLCPREADPGDLVHTAISGDEFSALLATIPAQKLLVIVDACHAAGSADLKASGGTVVWKAGLSDDYYEALGQGSGRVVVASSRENQFSYVRQQDDLSLFTYHLLQALSGKAAVRGDGLVHVLDVFHHVSEAVQAEEPRQTPILKVKDLSLNFPIAVAPAQTSRGSKTAVASSHIAVIREQIVHDPIIGAKALSKYLITRDGWDLKRAEVDLKRADLERIQHDLDLFGPSRDDQAAKTRAVYFLLRVCMELEQQEQLI